MSQLARLANREVVSREPKEKVRKAMKSKPRPQTPITRSARGQECLLRFPCCNHDTTTTVLCHENGAGAGMKSEDAAGAYGCYACHMCLDGHTKRPDGFTREMMLDRFRAANEETRRILRRKGLIK